VLVTGGWAGSANICGGSHARAPASRYYHGNAAGADGRAARCRCDRDRADLRERRRPPRVVASRAAWTDRRLVNAAISEAVPFVLLDDDD
jgi:hypothetical protein